MNKALFLIPILAIAVIGALTFGLSTPSTIETQSIISDEQTRINAELEERGLTLIDGKWYSPDYLAQLDALEEMQKQADREGWNFHPPLMLGGFAEIIHKDIFGSIISQQTLHNRVVNEGEDFLIQQVFSDTVAGETADADQIGSICVSNEVGFVDTSETETASLFDTGNTLTGDNCIHDTTVTSTAQTAVIGALTFDAPTHVPASTVITGIGICQGEASPPFNDCADAQAGSSGIMWSFINIADVTLETSETVDITYTADFSSAGS